jgi:DNA-binding transcriptional regulator YdaS (Cro superfamily)
LRSFVGVSPQSVTNWLAGRQQLTGEQALALLEFLRRRR